LIVKKQAYTEPTLSLHWAYTKPTWFWGFSAKNTRNRKGYYTREQKWKQGIGRISM